MELPALDEIKPLYDQFTEGAAERIGGADRRLQPYVTTTDEDGSVLYEEKGFPLLDIIVLQNDARALGQYLTNAPWAIPRAPAIPAELEGDSPDSDYFLLAARSGSLDVLQMLLAHGDKGEDPQPPTQIRFKERGYELLNEAAKWGHVEMVRFLLEHQPLYADIHERDPQGFTPIASAASFYATRFIIPSSAEGVSASRNEAIINLLLDRGACACDIVLPKEGTEKSPDTVLTLAARWASHGLITTLINRGADVHAKVTKRTWALRFWNEYGDDLELDALFIA
ncbi:ankyrin protein, partial [Fusarium heterosporum]